MKEKPRYNQGCMRKASKITAIRGRSAGFSADPDELEFQKQVEITRPVVEKMAETDPDDLIDFCKAVEVAMQYIDANKDYKRFTNSRRLATLIGTFFVTGVRGIQVKERSEEVKTV